MKVTITDILMNKRNGVDVSIAPTEFYLAYCIVPQRQMLIEAPPVIREGFYKETGMNVSGSSSGLHWTAAQYMATNVYDGDLTIRLYSGLSVRVPNSQFLVPYVEIARDDLLVNSIGGNRTATLGRYFLTVAYLLVDHDANTFTLWQPNPSTGRPNLISVIEESTDQSCANTTSGGGTTSDSSTTATAAPSSSISISAVVGIAFGGMAGSLAVAIVVFLIIRRRRKRLAERAGAQLVGFSDNSTDEHAKPDVLTEMPDDSVPPGMVGTDLYPEIDGSSLQPERGQVSSSAAGRRVYELDGGGQAS